MLPNFFLAGAPKAGTTSLYHYLDQHPQIYMSPVKEPCHFSDEIRPENIAPEMPYSTEGIERYLAGPMTRKRFGGPVIRWGDYQRLFDNVRGEIAIGEASVCYLWSPSAARNIAAAVPDAKIIVVLRDPVDRAWSQYVDMVARGGFTGTFDDLVDAAVQYRCAKITSYYPLLEFGLYGEQIERYRRHFAADRIEIHGYEDLCRDPAGVLQSIFRFLDVDGGFVPDTSVRHRPSPSDQLPPMSGRTRALLEEYYSSRGAFLVS